jgi:hypothetical protein
MRGDSQSSSAGGAGTGGSTTGSGETTTGRSPSSSGTGGACVGGPLVGQPRQELVDAGFIVHVATGDLNGDGLDDLVFITSNQDLGFALSDGDGHFGAPKLIAQGIQSCEILPIGGAFQVISWGQYGGPGQFTVTIWKQDPGGEFSAAQVLPVELAARFEVADLNGDSLPDLVDGAWVAFGTAPGTFGPFVLIDFPLLWSGYGDFWTTASFFPWLSRAEYAGVIAVSGPDGLSTYAAAVMYLEPDGGTAVNRLVGGRDLGVLAGRFTQRGRPDILIANSDGGTVFKNQGDGRFTLAGPVLASESFNPYIRPVVADLNNDGLDDVLSIVALNAADGGCTNAIVFTLGSEAGTFDAGIVSYEEDRPDCLTVALAVGDFHGNRRPATVIADDGRVLVFDNCVP